MQETRGTVGNVLYETTHLGQIASQQLDGLSQSLMTLSQLV